MKPLVRRLKAKAWLLVGYESKCQGEVLPFLIGLRNNQMFSFSFWLDMQPNVKVRVGRGCTENGKRANFMENLEIKRKAHLKMYHM